MSRTFSVTMTTSASATVDVELSDEVLQNIAVELDVPVDQLTVNDLDDAIGDAAEPPELCAACAGFSHNFMHSLDLGEDWEIDYSAIEEVTL